MIEGVYYPLPERSPGEEHVLLAELVQLGIPIEYTRRDELVENADHQWRQKGKYNIIKRKGPGLVGDLSGKVVEEGVLKWEVSYWWNYEEQRTRPKLRHVKCNVLIERICKRFLIRLVMESSFIGTYIE